MERADGRAGPASLERSRRPILAALVLLGLAALVAAAVLRGGGSSDLELVPVGAGAVVLLAVALVGVLAGLLPRPAVGVAGEICVFALVALVLWSGASIAWSIAPDASWGALVRGLAYAALLCLGAVAGSLGPRAPSAAAGAIGLLVAAALGWALVAKVFPALNEDGGRIARLRLPVGYWNALAILFVLAIPIALWLASERARRPGLRAGAVLFGYALVLGLLMTYSRGGIVAGAVVLAVWLALSHRRLESVLALAVALPVAIGVFAFTLRLPGVVDDGQEYAVRAADGRVFGLALLIGGAVAWGLAFAVFRLEAGRPVTERARRRLGRATIAALALVALLGAVAAGIRAGAVADWVERQADEFANPPTTLVTQEAERLTSLSSNNRWTWWNEAWDAFRTSPVGGTGAGSFATVHRILRQDELTVTEPHSMPLQLLAETGVVGAVLGCAAGAAALAGAFAAVRRVRPGERQAALALAVGVLAYMLQSLIDFDWSYVAASAPVLVVTGVLFAAGRSPRTRRAGLGFVPLVAAVAAAAIVVLGAPWLAERRVDEAYAALGEGRAAAALAAAKSARSLNPLALDPLLARAAAEIELGEPEAARATLVRAVELRPLDSDTWYELGAFELRVAGRPEAAVRYLERARELDPFGPAADLLDEVRA